MVEPEGQRAKWGDVPEESNAAYMARVYRIREVLGGLVGGPLPVNVGTDLAELRDSAMWIVAAVDAVEAGRTREEVRDALHWLRIELTDHFPDHLKSFRRWSGKVVHALYEEE